MKSPLLRYYGGPSKLRQTIRDEIIAPLQKGEGLYNKFSVEIHAPSNDRVRSLRTKFKRRENIFDYERDRAKHLFTASIHVMADASATPLASYDNGARLLTLNTSHHAALVKAIQSTVAFDWPTTTIQLRESGGTPRYSWGAGEVGTATVSYSNSLQYMSSLMRPIAFFDEYMMEDNN